MNRVRETRHSNNIPAIHTRHNYFNNSFFPWTISKWNNLDCKIRNSRSLSIFKKTCLTLYGHVQIVFLILITQDGLNHLRDHKFRHCFQDTLNPLCDCGNDTETTTYFFLHCPSFQTTRQTLVSYIRNIHKQSLSHDEDQLIQTFLYGNPNFNLTVNRLISNATIEYLISTERLKCPFFN